MRAVYNILGIIFYNVVELLWVCGFVVLGGGFDPKRALTDIGNESFVIYVFLDV